MDVLIGKKTFYIYYIKFYRFYKFNLLKSKDCLEYDTEITRKNVFQYSTEYSGFSKGKITKPPLIKNTKL